MFRRFTILLLLISILIGLSQYSANKSEGNFPHVQPQQLSYSLTNAFPSLSFLRPVDFQFAEDGSNLVYVVEQAGRIYYFNNNNETTSKSLYLDIVSKVDDSGNEEGLLGLAFSPNFTSDRYFFVHYNTPGKSRIARFSHNNLTGLADPNSEFVVLEINQPYDNHNGGQIAFGEDGMLYIAFGDGGSAGDPLNNGQSPDTLLGSLLRIDISNPSGVLNYTIPSDNPFYGMSGFREEIYAYGLRNPWRFSFDRQTDDLWLADVGQNNWEEVDRISSGGNYGWNTMEGTHCYSPSTNCNMSGLILPVFEYNHTLGSSITGGYVYRGSLSPGLFGNYVFGDFGSGRIWITNVENNQTTLILEPGITISSFGTDQNDEIYLLSFDGNIYTLVESGYIPPVITVATTSQTITVTTVINNTTTTITSVSEITTTITSSATFVLPTINSTIPIAFSSNNDSDGTDFIGIDLIYYLTINLILLTIMRKNKKRL